MTFEDLVKANATIKTIDFRGKQYAEVNQRVKAFRMLFPDGFIRSHIVSLENGVCVMQAEVGFYDPATGEEHILGVGTAYEREGSTNINKTSFIENCETSSWGRALAACGLGVDMSIASKEEVENAVEQQDGNKTIDDAKVASIVAKAKKDDVPIELLCAAYKVDSLSDMTIIQYKKCMDGWAQIKEWSDKKKNASEGNN